MNDCKDTTPIRIVGVCDSLNPNGKTRAALSAALEERPLNVGRQVVKFASLQQEFRQTDFAKLWEGLPTW